MTEDINSIQTGKIGSWPQEVVVYTDGACRGNPGPSSVGIHVIDGDGELIFEYAKPLGTQTNNYAEYMAVIMALEFCVKSGVRSLTLRSDSQLLIRQLIGEYKVKAEGLRPLFLKAKSLSQEISNVQFEHVRREFNKRADALANQALDELI